MTRHFMTRRFDRTADGEKLHMLSVGAVAHLNILARNQDDHVKNIA